ncbi:Polynucleotide adenylyltransferase region [Balamuthia mandrillaris]
MGGEGDASPFVTVVTGHMSADFDALAATVLAGRLFALKDRAGQSKEVERREEIFLLFAGSMDEILNAWIKAHEDFLKQHNFIFSLKEIDCTNVRRLVMVDGRNYHRFSHVHPLLELRQKQQEQGLHAEDKLQVHIYDHHPNSENDVSGDYETVRRWGSCTTILLSELHKLLKERESSTSGLKEGVDGSSVSVLTKEEATLAGLALYDDTGFFTYDTTTLHDFEMASFLLSCGMDLSALSEHRHQRMNQSMASSGGGIHPSMIDEESKRLAEDIRNNAKEYIIHDQPVIISQVASEQYVKNLSSMVQGFMEVEQLRCPLFVVARLADRVVIVARGGSKDEEGQSVVDVGRICQSFGGGGHAGAASATVKDVTAEQVHNELYALLVSHMSPPVRLEQIMTKPPVVAYSKQTMADVSKLFLRFNLKKAPVVEGLPPSSGETVQEEEKEKEERRASNNNTINRRKVVGILDRVITEKAVHHNLSDVLAEEYMSTDFSYLYAKDPLDKAIEVILGEGQRIVPIMAGDGQSEDVDESLVGVISRTDLMHILLQEPSRFPVSFAEAKRRRGKERMQAQQKKRKSGEEKREEEEERGNASTYQFPSTQKRFRNDQGTTNEEEEEEETQKDTKEKSPEMEWRERETAQRNIVLPLMKSSLSSDIFEFLTQAGDVAKAIGCRVFVVGGFVRDLLMHRQNDDIDLVVEGDIDAFTDQLAKEVKGKVKKHAQFKTAVIALPNQLKIDVCMARLEYYPTPAALPTVELSSIKMDMYRRDFTINAMAIELTLGALGSLVDFFDCKKDIQQGKIRVLHSLSFVEDPTRILRAIRFEQRFGFSMGAQTLKLVKNCTKLQFFQQLSGSRLFHELEKMFCEEDTHVPFRCVKRLKELQLLDKISPRFKTHPPQDQLIEAAGHTIEWYLLSRFNPPLSNEVRWKLYLLAITARITKENEFKEVMSRFLFPEPVQTRFVDSRKHARQALRTLRSWSEEAKEEEAGKRQEKFKWSNVYNLLKPLPLEAILFMLSEINAAEEGSNDSGRTFAQPKKGDEQVRRLVHVFLSYLQHMKLEMNGNDLKKMGFQPSPLFSSVLKQVFKAKLDGNVHNKTEELELAKSLMDDGLQNK